MNKVKNFFGISMGMVTILGLALSLTACADQALLGPNGPDGQSIYGENKIGDEEVPVVDMEVVLRLGTDYNDDGE